MSALLVVSDAAPDEQSEEFLRALRQFLGESEASLTISHTHTDVPVGSKSAPTDLGDLVIALGGSSGILGLVVSLIRARLQLAERRKIRLEIDGDSIEVTGGDTEAQRRLVTAWIARHEGRPAQGDGRADRPG
jgi:hypothetical protein